MENSKSENLKSVIISLLHSVHDSALKMQLDLEKLLTLFGEDTSWYENWRKDHNNDNEHNINKKKM